MTVTGEAAELNQVERAVRRFKPDEGEPLNHGVYEQSKADVEAALLNNGFLQMKPARPPRVEVTRKANTATIDLEYESGPRMKFGDVHFSEAQFPPEFLSRYILWKRRRLLLAGRVAHVPAAARRCRLLRHRLGAARPQERAGPRRAHQRRALACQAHDLHRRRLRRAPTTGPGVKLGLQRRWVNDRRHKFQADIDYAQRLQAFSTSYRIPLPGPDDKSLNFGVTHRNEDTDTSKSKNDQRRDQRDPQVARVHAHTRRCSIWRALTRSRWKIASRHLLYGEATLTRKKANDFFFPRRGWSLAFGARFAPEGLLSNTSFTQFTADGKYIMPMGRRQRLLTRLSLGSMVVKDFDELPPELRFFAGGDRSIRGFDYQELGSTRDYKPDEDPTKIKRSDLVIGGTKLPGRQRRVREIFHAAVGRRGVRRRRRRVARRGLQPEHRRRSRRALALTGRRGAAGSREAGEE